MSKLYKCTCCNKMKQPYEFHIRKSRAKGITSKCKLCISNEMKEYYSLNQEKILESKKVYREEKRDKINESNRNIRSQNPELVREKDRLYYKSYREKYPEKITTKMAKRRSQKSNAMPDWLSEKDISKIRSIYKLRSSISKKTGIEHHVDHIVPLIHPDVCGLHVPWNLRIITKQENLKKSNTLVEDIV